MLTIYGFSSYGAEPVEPSSTFVHVLNLPVSEDIWPGEWVEQFPQQYFATQHKDGAREYLARGSVEEHMRYELLRMAKGAHFPEGRHDYLYNEHVAFHRYVFNYDPHSPEKLTEDQYEEFYQSLDVELDALDESRVAGMNFEGPHFPAETNPLTEKEDK